MKVRATTTESTSTAIRFGQWTLVRQLGEGSSGSVHEAVDALGRRAAVKRLASPPGDEWRALCRVVHPAVVAALDSSAHPQPYIAMELANGHALSHSLDAENRLSTDAVIQIGGTLISALEAVHMAGIHHGDVKPDNVMLDPHTGQVRLVDFGLSGRPSGGTLGYVAPEILAKGPTGPRADVYSLAMTLLALLQASPPQSDGDALFARIHRAPEVQVGPGWLRDILQSMLNPRPEERPTAVDIVDVFAANGAHIPTPDARQINRRAAAVHVERPAVAVCAAAWLERGGSVALLGQEGSGKTHTLRLLAQELAARGDDAVWLQATPEPRASLAHALRDRRLPGPVMDLPRDPSPRAEARITADALQSRVHGKLWLLVDDFDALDPSTQETVELLCRRQTANVALATGTATPCVDATLTLDNLGKMDVSLQIVGLLGSADPRLVDTVWRESSGRPGAVVDAVLGAVGGEALVYRRSRWVLDPDRLTELVSTGALLMPASEALSSAARLVGGLLAISPGAIDRSELSTLCGLEMPAVDEALRELIDVGWAEPEEDGGVRCATAGARSALNPSPEQASTVHRALADSELAKSQPDPAAILHHLLGCDDESALRTLAAPNLEAVLRHDPTQAARLALRLLSACPRMQRIDVAVQALVLANEFERALPIIETALETEPPNTEAGLLLVQRSLVSARNEAWDDALADLDRAAVLMPGDPRVLTATAEVCFRAGRHTEAINAAKSLATGAPPSEPLELDRWLRLRLLWAQSLLRVEGAAAALAVLADVEVGLGADRTAGAVLDGVRGRICWHAGDLAGASAALQRAASSQASLSTIDRSKLQNNAALALYQTGSLNLAIDHWEQALLGFERLGDVSEQLRVQINLCQGLREVGRPDRAKELGRAALAESRRRGSKPFELVVLGNLGDLALSRGDSFAAGARFTEADALATELQDHSAIAELARRRAELAVSNRDSNARKLALVAVDAATNADATFDLARAKALLTVARIREHETVDVEAALHEITGPLRGSGAAGDLAAVRRWLAEAMLEDGRTNRAVELATQAVAWADEVGHVQLRRDADDIVSRARRQGGINDSGPLQRLVRTSIKLSRIREADALIQAVAEAAVDVLEVERAFVLVLDEKGQPTIAASSLRPGAQEGLPSMSVVRRTLAQRRELLATDLEERSDLRTAASVQALELRAALCMPLLDGPDLLGAIYVDSGNAVQNPLIEASAHLRALAAFAATAVADRRRQAEATRRADHAADLVHDVRNMLTSVGLLMEQVVADDAAEPWALTDTRESLNALERCDGLLVRFLDGATVQPEVLDLRPVIEDVLAQLRPMGRAHGVIMTCEGSESAPVLGDPQELPRAISNLVENAVKHGQAGGEVTVSITTDETGVVVAIRDRGPGLPTIGGRVGVASLFKHSKHAGHGRGLAIARRVIEAHGGRLAADNDPEGGACLTLFLPPINGDLADSE